MNRRAWFCLLLFCLTVSAFSAYKDHTFYSALLQQNRSFRVYTGVNFVATGAKKYPVIYYCHGCGGTYQGDQYTSYSSDGGYTPEYCLTHSCAYPMTKPYNADFQDFTDKNDVIIVMIDGQVADAPGCYAWYAYGNGPAVAWSGNEYRFATHFREIIRTVDSLYPTYADAQHRAVTGLSMGGHSAIWLAAGNPGLLRSMSSFCHSPPFWRVGGPDFTTPVDVSQLWRNFRGVSTRTTANSGDYLYYFSRSVALHLDGATLDNEYHLTPFWRHWAFHIDSQFTFHMKTFGQPRQDPVCFSHVNLYPSFDVWGYDIASNKRDTGWIYLKDVTRSGFGLVTRKWLPFGTALAPFNVTVTTSPRYTANGAYTVNRYDYRTGAFSTAAVSADAGGRITLTAAGGMGEELGIAGTGQSAALSLLTDTLCENIVIPEGRDTVITGSVVNLSGAALSGASVRVVSASPLLTVTDGNHDLGSFAAQSKKQIDTLSLLRGSIAVDMAESTMVGYWSEKSIGFIKVKFTGTGVDTVKEHLIQVHVARSIPEIDSTDVKIFDGRSENLTVFVSSDWSKNFHYLSTVNVSEGVGNGNGRIDSGETVSFWVRVPMGLSIKDTNTWHPVVSVGGQNWQGAVQVGCNEYWWNRGRQVLSGLMKFTRKPTLTGPVSLRLRAEVLRSFTGGQQRLDGFEYRYSNLRLPLSLAIGNEAAVSTAVGKSTLSVNPNPFNPATKIRFHLPAGETGPISLKIFDLSGREIRKFEADKSGTINWTRDDNSGRPVAAGVYMVRLKTGRGVAQAKAVVLP